jgi:hypothetical protein
LGSAQVEAITRQVVTAPEQKFFASFFQKIRPSLLFKVMLART